MTFNITDPTAAQRIVFHAEASRYTTIAGFAILIMDHFYTLDEEIELMWTAPRSFVKILFLGNRYITPIFQTIIVYEMSRLAVFSDTFCKWWITASGFAEISSMAVADLLLLLRVHALWERRRSVVIGTFAVYAFAYTCITIFGFITAFDVIPKLRYHPLAKMCVFESKPKIMPAMWSVSIICELTVFVMTAFKAFEHHTSENSQSPLLKTLYYDQLSYYIIIIGLRLFNLLVWVTLPQSLFFLGLFFIWSLITALVSRIMLHLRSVACAHSRPSMTSWFGETAVKSTRIVWARQDSELDTSVHFIHPEDRSVPLFSTVWDGIGENREIIELPQLGAGGEGARNGGEP